MSRWGFHLLGLILLYCGCSESKETIDVTIHGGTVGQVVSYNYPFVYDKAGYNEFNYRIFSNTQSAKSICLKFHRFDMRYGGTLTINSGYGLGTYYKIGEQKYPNSGIFPRDVWLGVFCVPLKYEKDYLEVTFIHFGNYVRGFQFDYWATSPYNTAQVYPTPQQNYPIDSFVCYNRKDVPLSSICDYRPDCEDSTDETFAHAQCTDFLTDMPVQRPGIWACNFDGGVCPIEIDINSNWKTASSVASDEDGPTTDHTYSSSGKRGKFIYTDFGDWRPVIDLWFDPKISATQDSCLSFWYFMSSNAPGKLSVGWKYGKQLWQRSGSYGYNWLHGQVYLKSGGYHSQIEFVAERDPQTGSRMSLDDISVLPGQCPYTDGSFTSLGWDFADCNTYSSANNSIKCNSENEESVVSSPMIASGKCLVLSVRFPSGYIYPKPSVEVYQLTLGTSDRRFLGKIIQQDYMNREETKKYTIRSTNPFKIRLHIYSDQGKGVKVDNFYVVDTDCDSLSLGSCATDEFYCSEEQCIKSFEKCDGIRDCNNGRDENDCTYTIPGVTMATGLIGACIFILLGLTCILYSINKKSTQRAREARDRHNEEIASQGQMFLVEDWEQGANPGFPFDDPDNLPPSYNDCVADRGVVPRGTAEGDDTADSTSLPPYDDFLTGSFVELNPITLKPMNQPDE